MMPSPSDLTYFITIGDLENLSRAAERLGISQPSLSLAMQRLEQSMGTPLLIRHKKGVSLTKAGKQLHLHARQLVEQWERIKNETLASTNAVQGDITLGCHVSVGRYMLPYFLKDLLIKHPQLNIRLEHDLSRKITSGVINLNIDIGIVVNPIEHPDLIIKKLATDKITLFQAKTLTKQQISPAKNDILICDPDLLQTQHILKKLKKRSKVFERLVTSSSLEVIADLTQQGLGTGVLPTRIAKMHDLIPLANAPFYEDEICLIYKGQHRDVAAIRAITEAIKQALDK